MSCALLLLLLLFASAQAKRVSLKVTVRTMQIYPEAVVELLQASIYGENDVFGEFHPRIEFDRES
jgi:hypothetical protein